MIMSNEVANVFRSRAQVLLFVKQVYFLCSSIFLYFCAFEILIMTLAWMSIVIPFLKYIITGNYKSDPWAISNI